jgi:hypothetical protein
MLAGLFSKPLFYLGLIVVGLFFLWGISRNWNCRPVKPPRPPHSDTFCVVEVPTGASLTVAYGLMGKKRATVALPHIQAPMTGPEAEASIEALSLAAGDVVRIEWHRGGILRGTDDVAEPLTGLPQQEPVAEPEQTTGETTGLEGPPEARPPDVGTVYGESGQDLALAQLSGGFATCLPGASKEYIAAEKAAKRRK